jgi:hypothetical protein
VWDIIIIDSVIKKISNIQNIVHKGPFVPNYLTPPNLYKPRMSKPLELLPRALG